MNIIKQIVKALAGTPKLRLKRGKDIGAFVNRSDEVEHLWVSEEWKAKPHSNSEALKDELLAYLSLGEAKKNFTCPFEVYVAYEKAASWSCLWFAPNSWTDDGGYIVSIDETRFRERLQSTNDTDKTS